MKTILFALTLFSLFLHNTFSQTSHELFSGKWYSAQAPDCSSIIKLYNYSNDSVYYSWDFTQENSLQVFENEIIDFYKLKPKDETEHITLMSVGSNDQYQWTFVDSINELRLINKRFNNVYIVQEAERSYIILKMKYTKVKKIKDDNIVYYFNSPIINANSFLDDTLVFKAKNFDGNSPRLFLKNTSQFCIFYNVDRDTITKLLPDGTYIAQVVEKSDKIDGIWQSTDLTKKVNLKFGDDIINQYNIESSKDNIYFIKQ